MSAVPVSLDMSLSGSLTALGAMAAATQWTQHAAPIRILLVDDDPRVRTFVDRVLREAGYQTTVASHGAEALEIAEALGAFDVLLADVMMPQMTGDELARRLRQLHPGLKVLYLTGYSDQLFKDKGTLWEDEAFLDKPFTVKGLVEAVSLLVFGHVSTAAFPTAAATILRDAAEEPKRLTTRSPIEITPMRQRGLQSKPVTVLVVDDDPAVTETFGRMLTLEGYIVRSALSAEAGLHEADIGHPDAILLDLRMPLVDGLAFLRRLRARNDQRQTPVAIITGDYFVDDTVSHELYALGAEVHFKPLWLEDLVRITDSLVHVDR